MCLIFALVERKNQIPKKIKYRFAQGSLRTNGSMVRHAFLCAVFPPYTPENRTRLKRSVPRLRSGDEGLPKAEHANCVVL
jgi:hypothetical protein